MNYTRVYCFVAGSIFLGAAVMHLTRLMFGWEAVFAGWSVPHWLSWIGLPLAVFLSFAGFALARKQS